MAGDLAEDHFGGEVVKELLLFLVEDARHNVRPVGNGLAREKGIGDFGPFGIAGECDEQVGLALGSHNGHGVLVELHEPPEARKTIQKIKACWDLSGWVCAIHVFFATFKNGKDSPGAADEGGWQNNALADSAPGGVAIMDSGVHDSLHSRAECGAWKGGVCDGWLASTRDKGVHFCRTW
jgi:hypothetical protein